MRTRWILLFSGILLLFTACSPGGNCANDKALHVLFIGNSYTYVNDLPGVFTQLACAGGHKVETGMAASGGWTLAMHLASPETLDKIKQQQWDLVILQEQSEIPAIPASRAQSMAPAARQLVGQILKSGAEPMLFLTWAHRDGAPEYGIQNFNDMQAQLDIGYFGIGRQLGVHVIPVGDVWTIARNQPDAPELWDADGSHPNKNGTYLAACVFYASIFQQDPRGLSYTFGLAPDVAKKIQALAAEAVLKKDPLTP